MAWVDIAMIVFACTAANHLGLIDAVEKTVGFKLPIVNCCKCCAFWLTLAYCVLKSADFGAFTVVAVSFLASICAIWLELLMGFIDTLYDKAYGRIFDKAAVRAADRHEDSATAKDADDTEGTVSEVQPKENDFD